MFYDYEYYPAQPKTLFQGTKAELAKKLKANPQLFVVGGGNGSWVLAGYSFGRIYEFDNEYSRTLIRSVTPSKDLIRLMHNKTKVTEKDYQVIAEDLNSGKLSFDELTKPLY